MAYSYSPKTIQRYDWQVQSTIYYDLWQNEAHNARIWKAKYETLGAKVQRDRALAV